VDLPAYIAEFNAWLDANATDAPPPAASEPLDAAGVERRRRWQATLAAAGYLGITWPREYGGAEGTSAQAVAVAQALDTRNLAGPLDFVGVDVIAPTLLVHGTAEQKARLLPPTLTGAEMWCQPLSEPGAGSDVAAIQTRARLLDDGTWIVNGQKVWTSFAHLATWGFMLARTSDGPRKHDGLTVFILPMDAEGVAIRPLRQIGGEAEFNEVFLDDVQLSTDAIIGRPGDGWLVLLAMLGFERMAVGSGLAAVRVERLAEALAGRPLEPTHELRLGQVASELLSLRDTSARIAAGVADGVVPGPEAGFIKITTVTASFAACRLVVDVLGPQALLDGEWGHQVSVLPGIRSASGTEEILRNVIGERVLGLPPEPAARVDRK
jgi:alkylation response protein AidB-like acyl-CoA dehydrogenase